MSIKKIIGPWSFPDAQPPPLPKGRFTNWSPVSRRKVFKSSGPGGVSKSKSFDSFHLPTRSVISPPPGPVSCFSPPPSSVSSPPPGQVRCFSPPSSMSSPPPGRNSCFSPPPSVSSPPPSRESCWSPPPSSVSSPPPVKRNVVSSPIPPTRKPKSSVILSEMNGGQFNYGDDLKIIAKEFSHSAEELKGKGEPHMGIGAITDARSNGDVSIEKKVEESGSHLMHFSAQTGLCANTGEITVLSSNSPQYSNNQVVASEKLINGGDKNDKVLTDDKDQVSACRERVITSPPPQEMSVPWRKTEGGQTGAKDKPGLMPAWLSSSSTVSSEVNVRPAGPFKMNTVQTKVVKQKEQIEKTAHQSHARVASLQKDPQPQPTIQDQPVSRDVPWRSPQTKRRIINKPIETQPELNLIPVEPNRIQPNVELKPSPEFAPQAQPVNTSTDQSKQDISESSTQTIENSLTDETKKTTIEKELTQEISQTITKTEEVHCAANINQSELVKSTPKVATVKKPPPKFPPVSPKMQRKIKTSTESAQSSSVSLVMSSPSIQQFHPTETATPKESEIIDLGKEKSETKYMDKIEEVQPEQPTQPAQEGQPTIPVQPAQSAQLTQPAQPAQLIQPAQPTTESNSNANEVIQPLEVAPIAEEQFIEQTNVQEIPPPPPLPAIDQEQQPCTIYQHPEEVKVEYLSKPPLQSQPPPPPTTIAIKEQDEIMIPFKCLPHTLPIHSSDDPNSPDYVLEPVTSRIQRFENQLSMDADKDSKVAPTGGPVVAKPIGPWVKRTSSGPVAGGDDWAISPVEGWPDAEESPFRPMKGGSAPSQPQVNRPVGLTHAQLAKIQQDDGRIRRGSGGEFSHSYITVDDTQPHKGMAPNDTAPNSSPAPIASLATSHKSDGELFDPWCDPKNPRCIQFQDISAAAFKIKSGIMNTPCTRSNMSNVVGMDVFFKKEFNQFTGSFKERGARYTLLCLPESQKVKGVIAASAGNHALALSYHGQLLGISVTVVMPLVAPIMKVQACRQYGANIIVTGKDIGECKEIALKLSKDKDLTYINGYDHPHILAGQGTMGLEIVEQVADIDAVVIPVGGGGLIAGVALAVKSLYPHIKVIGVESDNCPSFSAALRAGHPVQVPTSSSLADGLAVPTVGVNAFATAKNLIDKVVTVREEWIAIAILRLVEIEKAVVEGAGATALAALLAGELPELKGKRVVIPLCGGNIDTTVLGRCLERGMAADGRLVKFTVTVSDRPGGIADLTRLLANLGVSIKDMLHERAWIKSDIFSVEVKVVAETRDYEHLLELKTALVKRYGLDRLRLRLPHHHYRNNNVLDSSNHSSTQSSDDESA